VFPLDVRDRKILDDESAFTFHSNLPSRTAPHHEPFMETVIFDDSPLAAYLEGKLQLLLR
jgi:hypothetical protein